MPGTYVIKLHSHDLFQIKIFSKGRNTSEIIDQSNICLLAESEFLRIFALQTLPILQPILILVKTFFVIFTCCVTYPKVCIKFLFAVIYLPPDINEFQKRRSIQPIWVIAFYGCRRTLIKNWSRGTLRSTGTLSLLSPGYFALYNNLVGVFFSHRLVISRPYHKLHEAISNLILFLVHQ